MAFKFKCIIKSQNAKANETPYKTVDMKEDDVDIDEDDRTVFLDVFKSMVKNTHKVPGFVTIHRSKEDRRTGNVLPVDDPIEEMEFAIGENEILYILYDEKVKVTPGGYGSGGQTGSSNGDAKAVAEGGKGTGGRVDSNGMSRGGAGKGGDVYSKTGHGKGGTGIGGMVDGKDGRAGAGAGGDVNEMLHRSMARTEEQRTSKSISSTHGHRGNR